MRVGNHDSRYMYQEAWGLELIVDSAGRDLALFAEAVMAPDLHDSGHSVTPPSIDVVERLVLPGQEWTAFQEWAKQANSEIRLGLSPTHWKLGDAAPGT